MPELPEVESIRQVLLSSLKNQKINKYNIKNDRINRFNNYKPRVSGFLLDINRKGKLLIFEFSKYSFLFHLGMSGRLNLNNKETKYTHAIFNFEQDILNYEDIRKFGYIKILPKEIVQQHLNNIGPDALTISKQETEDVFKKTSKSNITIKRFLLNQNNISGIGNIYVNEILFQSKISPFSPSMNLKEDQFFELINSTKKILKNSIENKGTTLNDFTYYLPNGNYGQNQINLLIYGKTFCSSCSSKIDKIYLDKRATYECKICQKFLK